MNQKKFRIITWGKIGDLLVCTPVFKALKELHPGCRVIVYCVLKQHQEVLKNNPYIDRVKSISLHVNPIDAICYFTKLRTFHHLNIGTLQPGWVTRVKAADLAAALFDLKLANKQVQLFLTDQEERKALDFLSKYKCPVTVNVHSSGPMLKNWSNEKWQKLAEEMPEVTFIQLGARHEPLLEGAVDMRGKTTLRESFALIKHSKSFIGVDSALAHAAGAFNTPGVVLFGPTYPGNWGHSGNINIYKAQRCSPCIGLITNVRCPYHNECMSRISVSEVKQALLTQLQRSTTPALESDVLKEEWLPEMQSQKQTGR